MNVLVDTHIALWFLDGSPALSVRARELVEDFGNRVFLSDVSVWEVAIKHVKRPDVMHRSFAGLVELCDRVDLTPFP